MARIRSFERGTQSIGVHSTEVDCFYQAVQAVNGDPYLHLSTFGSDARASSAKSSQSIQLDREMAAALMAILVEAFPDLG